ncbi:hypothetical protein ASPZODRAFT_159185 [Penicilliopsis zonata CBS 506.65]|uniref:Velvet domain-containing protein n=1 Tax=Penicilliopsis zonata CBS 506.65 TaxID=1073090 RepID=A0A1L9SJ66_9EURO|nr:hypothetical protein ASPZODRAFT_159185 [Penicilliopsis zonata CBS 506.65]OJJ47269.1 hypothetical protein ASPZODRAFT_159185 [Penicilliopsis zonata CBS 506.65]
MVQSTSSNGGTSSREFGLSFEISPPAAVRPRTPFTLPLIVAVRPVGNPSGGSIQQLVVNASLRNESGSASAPGLSGGLTSSVRSRQGNTISGFARFNSLTIQQPGRYRIRVMLGAASANGVVTKTYVDSGVINVHAAAGTQRPTAVEVGRLQRLVPENLDITTADITRWQNA